MADRIETETEVYRRLIKLLDDGRSLRDYCMVNGAAVPEPLARLLGGTGSDKATLPSRMTIPPMPAPEMPSGAHSSWIWISEKDASVVSLVLAWLRQASAPLTPSQIFSDLTGKRPSLSKGSIANMGARLEAEHVIERRDGAWSLLQIARAPILHDGFVWGKPSVLEKTELAAHRRNAVKHILGAVPDGLQIVQLTNALKESCPWFNQEIPSSKDLLKIDMQELEKEREVRRKGNSGKWELTS